MANRWIGGGVCWVLPWKGRGRKLGYWVLPWKGRGSGSFVANRCSEEGVVGSCHGKEEADDQSVVSDWIVGSYCGKEKAKNRPVASCCGWVLSWKGRGRGSICWVGSVCWVLPWKGKGEESACWVLPWKGNYRRVELIEEELGGR